MGGSLHQPDLPTPENLSSSDSALSLVICLLYSPKKIWEIVSYPHPMFLDSLDMSPQGPETSILAQLSAYYSLGATNWRFPSTEMYCSVVVVFWKGLLLTRPCFNLYICMPWMGVNFWGMGLVLHTGSLHCWTAHAIQLLGHWLPSTPIWFPSAGTHWFLSVQNFQSVAATSTQVFIYLSIRGWWHPRGGCCDRGQKSAQAGRSQFRPLSGVGFEGGQCVPGVQHTPGTGKGPFQGGFSWVRPSGPEIDPSPRAGGRVHLLWAGPTHKAASQG